MLELTTGNLLEADAEALVNTVNTEGVMGKGIALQFSKKFPEMAEAYRLACKAGEVRPGRMHIFERSDMLNPRYVISFPTKRHWRSPSRIEDIESGLTALVAEIQAPARLAQTMRRATAAGKAALRATRARMKRLMAAWGLYARGWNVFGWRRLAGRVRGTHQSQTPGAEKRCVSRTLLSSLAGAQEAKMFRQIEAPWKRCWPDANKDWGRAMGFATKLPEPPGRFSHGQRR